jgi:hypothetical protein
MQIFGNVLLFGQTTHQIQLVGASSGARFGQDLFGGFLASDTPGSSLRLLTHDGLALQTWFRVTSNGQAVFGGLPAVNGEISFSPSDRDPVLGVVQEAGPQMRLRLSRAECDWSNPLESRGCDLSNLAARDLILEPYTFGMQLEYPSTFELWVRDLSVHHNQLGCAPEDGYCNGGARLWVGNETDTGGLFLTAHAGATSAESWAVIAADRFDHSSSGSVKFQIRDNADAFIFEAGAFGAETPVARIDYAGKGYFNGGTQVGGADFAEAMEAAGGPAQYSPGDVLVIDREGRRRVRLATEPYSRNVAGVYSTRPGVLGTAHPVAAGRVRERAIPVALVGIVACKVSSENGPIEPGDLLVTSSTPGHAMKADSGRALTGAVIGKALEPFEEGTGVIEILVSLQ